MGKYSSDSENEKRGNKNSNKSRSWRRSSSSDSSGSRSKRKRNKRSSRKSRSRSRDKYSNSRRSRSSSTSTHRFSKSKIYRANSKERSRYRDDRRSRSHSKDRHRSRRSRSYIREYVSKLKKRSSSSSSSSSSDRSKKPSSTKASCKSGNVTGTDSQSIRHDSPDCVIVDSKVLDEINEDKFAPKHFTSSKSKKVLDGIVIDLRKNTIKVPEVEPLEPDSIFHHNLFLNEEARMEKWVKELYSYRQKALQQGLKTNR